MNQKNKVERFLELALEIIDSVSRANVYEGYEIICHKLSEGLHWDYAEVWMRDKKEPLLNQTDIYYSASPDIESIFRTGEKGNFAYNLGIPGLAWGKKEPLWINDIQTHPEFVRKINAKKAKLKTCLAVPILAEDYVDAVILFFSKNTLEIDHQLIKLMHILSSRIGINIVKKELEDMVQKYDYEAKKSIEIISKIFSLRDPYTISHENFVRNFAVSIGKQLLFTDQEIHDLSFAATLHDIGKIAIPMEILSKPSKLTVEEFALVKTHVLIGYHLIEDISFSDEVKRMVLEHHERIDGSGYPYGLKDEEIYIGSKVLSISDVVSAMLENRPYRAAHKRETVIEELTSNAGIKYDKDIAFLAIEILSGFPEGYFTSKRY